MTSPIDAIRTRALWYRTAAHRFCTEADARRDERELGPRSSAPDLHIDRLEHGTRVGISAARLALAAHDRAHEGVP